MVIRTTEIKTTVENYFPLWDSVSQTDKMTIGKWEELKSSFFAIKNTNIVDIWGTAFQLFKSIFIFIYVCILCIRVCACLQLCVCRIQKSLSVLSLKNYAPNFHMGVSHLPGALGSFGSPQFWDHRKRVTHLLYGLGVKLRSLCP